MKNNNNILAACFIEKGNVLYEAGFLEKALDEYAKAIEIDSNYSFAYYNRANIHYRTGNYSKALLDIEKCININIGDHKAIILRGLIFSSMNDSTKAIEDFSAVIKVTPDHAQALINRAAEYYKTNQYNNAISDYKTATYHRPYLIEAFHGLAISHLALELFKETIEDINNAEQLGVMDWEIYLIRAEAYADMGCFGESVRDIIKSYFHKVNFFVSQENEFPYEIINSIIEKIPRFISELNNRSQIIEGRDYTCKTSIDFNKLLDLSDSKSDVFILRAITLMHLCKYDSAYDDICKALENKTDDARALFLRGIIELRKKDPKNALKDFSKAIKLAPKFLEAYFYRAIINESQMQYYDALDDYDNWIALRPNDSIAYKFRGDCKLQTDQLHGAICEWEIALSLGYRGKDLYLDLITAHAILSDREKAKTYCKRAIIECEPPNIDWILYINNIINDINNLSISGIIAQLFNNHPKWQKYMETIANPLDKLKANKTISEYFNIKPKWLKRIPFELQFGEAATEELEEIRLKNNMAHEIFLVGLTSSIIVSKIKEGDDKKQLEAVKQLIKESILDWVSPYQKIKQAQYLSHMDETIEIIDSPRILETYYELMLPFAQSIKYSEIGESIKNILN
jgi:tetratricopeptide (TPR) repeat protein